MIFLIEYDKPAGRLIRFVRFDDSERRAAENSRLELELDLHRLGIAHEVVLLEAGSEAAVRRTHRRYFEKLSEIVNPVDRGGES